MESSPGNSKTRLIVIIGAAVILFGVLFAFVLSLYRAEGAATGTQYAQQEASKPGHVAIDARLVAIDPIKGDMSVRLQFTPEGDLVGEDQVSLTKNLVLDLNSSTGKTQHTFKKGERMNPTDVILDVYGNIGDYPFDQHEASLIIVLTAPKGGQDNASAEYEDVPFTVNYTGALAGYHVTDSEAAGKETGFLEIELDVKRSASAKTFAVFIMALEWLLALSALAVMVVLVSGRKIEVGVFGWMGALLFALIPLRNAMPAVPPVGVLSDFLAFFWAEIIVALSLVVSVLTWLFRSSAAI